MGAPPFDPRDNWRRTQRVKSESTLKDPDVRAKENAEIDRLLADALGEEERP